MRERSDNIRGLNTSLYEEVINMSKIVKTVLIGLIGVVLTVGTFGLYNYFKEKRS